MKHERFQRSSSTYMVFWHFFQSKRDVANKVKYLLASWLPFIQNILLTTLLVSVTIKQLAFETWHLASATADCHCQFVYYCVLKD